jgi:hypothetical protein
MNPILLVHGYSAESRRSSAEDIRAIYGSLPDDLRRAYGGAAVFELDVSRYISLEDGVRIDDISRAMDRALREEFPHLLDRRFDVIIHSTGALVVRNWIRRHSPIPSPIEHLIYLAGANFGSGWAHVGRGQLAKWARMVFQGGAERGVQILDALELGSSFTIDLHLHFLWPGHGMAGDYRVREFCVCGSQVDATWLPIPIRYAKEDGADGVVRVSSCNLNFNYVRLEPTAAARAMKWDEVDQQVRLHRQRKPQAAPLYEVALRSSPGDPGRPEIPLAIPYQCAHSGRKIGIVAGDVPRAEILRLIDLAVTTTDDASYDAARREYAGLTQQSYDRAARDLKPGFLGFHEPRQQYDKHAQLIIRMVDQHGRGARHFDIFFDAGELAAAKTKSGRLPEGHALPVKSLFQDCHGNEVTPHVITFYLRTHAFNKDELAAGRDPWPSRVTQVGDVNLEITATEPETDDIVYLPLRLAIDNAELERLLEPHRTTILDVGFLRLPSPEIFRIART